MALGQSWAAIETWRNAAGEVSVFAEVAERCSGMRSIGEAAEGSWDVLRAGEFCPFGRSFPVSV